MKNHGYEDFGMFDSVAEYDDIAIQSVPLANLAKNDLKKVSLFRRSIMAMNGKKALLEDFCRKTDIKYMPVVNGIGYTSGAQTDVLCFTPRVDVPEYSGQYKQSAIYEMKMSRNYVEHVLRILGFKTMVNKSTTMAGLPDVSVYVSMHDRDNFQLLQDIGWAMYYNHSNPLKQSVMDQIATRYGWNR